MANPKSVSVELLHCFFHLAQVRVGAGRVSHMHDLAVQADQEVDAPSDVPARHPHPVGVRDLAIGIRQQGEVQIVFGNELQMAVSRIEAHADDAASRRSKSETWVSPGMRSTFIPATRQYLFHRCVEAVANPGSTQLARFSPWRWRGGILLRVIGVGQEAGGSWRKRASKPACSKW